MCNSVCMYVLFVCYFLLFFFFLKNRHPKDPQLIFITYLQNTSVKVNCEEPGFHSIVLCNICVCAHIAV